MQARIHKDHETGNFAVFNPGARCPVHLGIGYWFDSFEGIKAALESRGLWVDPLGYVFNSNRKPAAIVFSWYRLGYKD